MAVSLMAKQLAALYPGGQHMADQGQSNREGDTKNLNPYRKQTPGTRTKLTHTWETDKTHETKTLPISGQSPIQEDRKL
jgi:hypothetical protein